MTINDEVECVGSLLIPTKDVQELSTSATEADNECVGSLLVHSKDAQVVSTGSPIVTKSALSHLKTRHTVGTLLVGAGVGSSENLASPRDQESSNSFTATSIRRRVTERMTGPPPADEEADTWAD